MRSLSDDTPWAVHECAEAALGDLRRPKRLIELATVLAQNPRASLPAASGNRAMLKAASRFLANEAIEPQDIVHSHIEATYGRLDTVPGVLAVPDTTEVHWTSRRATTGLGPLGHTACQGLFVPSTLAITPERVPLGRLAHQVWARDAHDVGKRARRKQLPLTQTESQQWRWRLAAVCNAHDGCPQTRFVSVGDRAADL
jgi:transposase-like protein